jgi:opacity protein-like surface antigen
VSLEAVRKIACAASLLLLASCARARDPVQEVLKGVVAAAESRDAEAVAGSLSVHFHDEDGGSKAETEQLLRRTLAAYEQLSLKLSRVVIERAPKAARVTFDLLMSGKPREVGGLEGLLPRASLWRFELLLELEKGGWKITSAVWRRLGEGG